MRIAILVVSCINYMARRWFRFTEYFMNMFATLTIQFICAFIVCTFACAEVVIEPYDSQVSDTRPLAPQKAADDWNLPPGFKVSVFAAEPEVRQPVALAMDERGRLWVAECYTYAEASLRFDAKLRDRILILEDTDGDGKADRRTIFADGLQRLSSIEIGLGGVWAITHPNLVFMPDRNRDDQPDGPPEIKLDGFESTTNHHTMANGLRWGPDGWLYGRQGIQATSAIGKPGTPENQRAHCNGGIWRYHPQRHATEVVCHGTTNPWGMDWNEYGEAFFINTVIGHLWHAIPGAHFRRMHGEDLISHTYDTIEQHADHVHWDTKESWDNWRKAGISDSSSAAGGGHAHTGLMFYAGDNWPAEWRGKLLTINFNGRRLNVENVVRTAGSGYVGKHLPDIAFSADSWFRGIDLLYGPDGGVFIADWSDTGECHENDGVHRGSGRIYKMTYGTPKPPKLPLISSLTPIELIPLLKHKNEHFFRHARRRFQEQAYTATDLNAARTALLKKLENDPSTIGKLRALWCLHASGGVSHAILIRLLAHPDEYLRTWAIRLLVDDPTSAERITDLPGKLAALAATERAASVRLTLASSLQRLPRSSRTVIASPLLARKSDAADHNLPQMLWYGIEPLAATDPIALATLGTQCELPLTRRCIARRLTALGPDGATALSQLLAHTAKNPSTQLDILNGIKSALVGERRATPPAAWGTVGPAFSNNTDPAVRETFRTLGVVFGDPLALEATRLFALDLSQEINARREALRACIESRLPGLRELCTALLPTPGLTATAADGLALEADPALADLILKNFSSLDSSEKNGVLSTLVSRPTWAARVLTAIASDSLPRDAISAFHARQIVGFNDSALNRQLAEVWGQFREPDTAKRDQIAAWKKRLTPEVLAEGDLDAGKVLFKSLCSTCHILNGEGGQLGPELTGSGRDHLDYLLQNILDPNAAVANAYQLTTVQMNDGRSLSGFIRSKNERILILKTLAEEIPLPLLEITSTHQSPLSLMPEGLLLACNENQVRDLIAYLMKK